ncbi:MAG: ribonuclease HI family protein [Dehalococcoidia bacterium]|nr:ribonuclease HI family protein [Dehalococcoidia bacterium]
MTGKSASGTYAVYADGASRGNPGPAAIGVVVYDPAGNEVYATSKALGRTTNNQAEYKAAIAGLEAALGLGARQVELRMDSELVTRQLSGRYRVRNPRLIPLHKRLLDLRTRFDKVSIRHVPRGENVLADKLANQALDNVSRQEPWPRQQRFDFPR